MNVHTPLLSLESNQHAVLLREKNETILKSSSNSSSSSNSQQSRTISKIITPVPTTAPFYKWTWTTTATSTTSSSGPSNSSNNSQWTQWHASSTTTIQASNTHFSTDKMTAIMGSSSSYCRRFGNVPVLLLLRQKSQISISISMQEMTIAEIFGLDWILIWILILIERGRGMRSVGLMLGCRYVYCRYHCRYCRYRMGQDGTGQDRTFSPFLWRKYYPILSTLGSYITCRL